MFETDPFIECPNCHAHTFGVLWVNPDSYTRQCAECRHRAGFSLPAIRKKVIFLDQNAISNMMVALNTRVEANERVDSRWRVLFERLDSLCKLHLIVCPQGPLHERESMVAPHYFRALRRMYRLLSHDTSFRDLATIERFQLMRHVRMWMDGRGSDEPEMDQEEYFDEPLHRWTNSFSIDVERDIGGEEISAIRESRDSTSEKIARVFAGWSAGKATFDEHFLNEMRSFGPATLRTNDNHLAVLAATMAGLVPSTGLELFAPPPAFILVSAMIRDLGKRYGLREDEARRKIEEYLTSDLIQNVPCVRIGCMLWAAIARKTEGGMRKPPTKGASNDIRTISGVLPACDALFLDDEMRAYLGEEPLRRRLDFGQQVFSTRTIDQFYEYLDAVEREAPPAHVAAAKEVYGEPGLRPYTAVYEDEDPTIGDTSEVH